MSEKVGVFNRLCWGSSSPGTVELEFLEQSTLGLNEQWFNAGGLMGQLGEHSERTAQGTRRVEGNLRFCPTPVELDTLLAIITGTASTPFALATTGPTTHYWGANRDGTLYNYAGCFVNTAVFRASEGNPLTVELGIIGTDETVSGSFPAVAIDLTNTPYMLQEATCSLGGTGYNFSSFALQIDYGLEVKYRNSATPTVIKATKRTVTLGLPVSLGTASALYGSALAGIAASVTFTNSGCSCVFTMPAVQAPRQPLPFGQRGVLDFEWQGVCRKSGSTVELSIANDSTP